MPTTAKLTHAMEAVIAEMDVHCGCLRTTNLERDEYLAIRQNLADGVVRGLIVISIHQKMLELQMDEFFLGARDQLDD
jgi:hypothetical protein